MKSYTELEQDFRTDFNHAQTSIEEFKKAKAYYHGEQLPPDVLNIIEERGQTPIVENIYKMIINKILGYKISSIQEVRLTPRQEQDKPLADLLNDLLKYFSQKRNYDKEIIKRDRDLLMGGLGVIGLWTIGDSEGNIDIEIKAISPESFIIDYFSTDSNALDARRLHKMLVLDEESLKRLLPGVEVVYNYNHKDRLAKIIESWYCEYDVNSDEIVWNRYIWSLAGGIYKFEPKPFKNGLNPFVVAKYYVDQNNNYYGLFRDIKPMQE